MCGVIYGVLWWSLPTYEVYSNYGHYLEYPRGMKVLEEESYGDSLSEKHGLLDISNKESVIIFRWGINTTRHTPYTLINWDLDYYSEEWDIVDLDEKLYSIIDGYSITYQKVIFRNDEGEEATYVIGYWYDSDQQLFNELTDFTIKKLYDLTPYTTIMNSYKKN